MSCYAQVNALMLSWKEVDNQTERKEFQTQLRALAEEFRQYRFNVEEYEIESERPYQMLSQRLHEFLGHDRAGSLLILYYGGHGQNNQDSHCIWLQDNPEEIEERYNVKLNWSLLQGLFLDDCASDVLFLLDCCYAGASALRTNSTSKVEAIVAAGFEQVAPLRGQDSFTTFLTAVLKNVREREESIVASKLAREISALLNSPQAFGKGKRVTPQHFPLHDGTTFIKIAPFLREKNQPSVLDTMNDDHKPQNSSQSQALLKAQALVWERSQQQGTNPRQVQIQESAGGNPYRHSKREPKKSKQTIPRKPHPIIARTPRSSTRGSEPKESRQFSIHDKYPISPNQIRVLLINPCSKHELDSRIYCSIQRVTLPSNTMQRFTSPKARRRNELPLGIYDYKALTWYRHDKVPWDGKLTVVDQSVLHTLPIPSELETALRDIREVNSGVAVWVDEACVNHANKDEKQVQELLKRDIFSHAAEVIIWPGQADISSISAIDFVPELINLGQIDELVIGSPGQSSRNNSRASPFGAIGLPHGHSSPMNPWPPASPVPPRTPTKSPIQFLDSEVLEKWQNLVEFMTRPYFLRRWAFLEVALAQRAKICCGERRVDWSDFCDAVTILGSRFDEVRVLFKRAAALGILRTTYKQLTDLRALGAYSFVEASRDLFPRQSDGSIVSSCRLEKIVSTLAALKSWHPNAVIYAVLPLAIDEEQWEERALPPAQAYQHFVHHCARVSGSINIICRPWAPTQSQLDKHQSETDEKLPSWVCQIDKLPFGEGGDEVPGRRNGEVFAGSSDRPLYDASKGSRANPVFGRLSDEGLIVYDGTMTISGFQVAPITKVYPRAIDGTISYDWIEAFGGEQRRIVPDHLWRTLVADRGPGGTPTPAWYHRACYYWLNYGHKEDDITFLTLSDDAHSTTAKQYLMRVQSVIWNRRLFTIEDENKRTLYGLAPRGTRERDVVCILNGCSVPVILRKHQDHWTLVGECFVYGIMDGEACDMRDEGAPLEEFLLR